jgi:predicted transcriptional regulator
VKKAMMKAPDEIDISILDRISRKPGCSISDAIRPLLIERSESVLRGRIRALELRKLIRFIPTKHKVLLYRNPAAENESDV